MEAEEEREETPVNSLACTNPLHFSTSPASPSPPCPPSSFSAMKLSAEIEIDSPPAFDMGDRVRVRKLIRNDGTFPGKDIGFHLAKKGDVGYIVGIGTYLQRAYVYSVHFLETNYVVGCLKKELELAEDRPPLIEQPDW